MAAVNIGSLWINPRFIVSVTDAEKNGSGYQFVVTLASGHGAQIARFETEDEAATAQSNVVLAIGG